MKLVTIKKEQLDASEMAHSWTELSDQPGQDPEQMIISINSGLTYQTVEGIGGSFSEIGGKALSALNPERRAEVVSRLFGSAEGEAGFTYCRLPIGSSDFGLSAYSLNDHDGDLDMIHFSLERDLAYMIPYVKAAFQVNPNLRIHASPWSPPAWMKTNRSAVEGGSVIDSPEIYAAYARYLTRFIEEYAKQGIPIDRLIIQNEPDIATKYPSCVMPVEQMGKFIVDYVRPQFQNSGIITEIWAGTFRTITGVQVSDFLSNDVYRNAVTGVGVQYSVIQQLHDIQRSFPGVKLMHTESVCYDGSNTWEQAVKLFTDFTNYMNAGCTIYTYWNMILDQNGKSAWDWSQNCLITIHTETGEVTYNPDYEVMSLIGKHVRPGARRVQCFSLNKRAISFVNTDGTLVLLAMNVNEHPSVCTVRCDGVERKLELAPRSIGAYLL